MGGDFNTILSTVEKKGGLDPDRHSMQDFHEYWKESNLSDMGYEGNRFTLCNGQQGRSRIWQRLDRILCNGEAVIGVPNITVHHLNWIGSDHSPLLVHLEEPSAYKKCFIFQRMWTDHTEFRKVVEETWATPISGSPSCRVAT